MAQRLAEANQKVEELEDQKKQVASQYAARIDSENGSVSSLSLKLRSGYEMRPTNCTVIFDVPNGVKRYYDERTGDYVSQATMTKSDYQRSLDFDAAKKQENEKEEEL